MTTEPSQREEVYTESIPISAGNQRAFPPLRHLLFQKAWFGLLRLPSPRFGVRGERTWRERRPCDSAHEDEVVPFALQIPTALQSTVNTIGGADDKKKPKESKCACNEDATVHRGKITIQSHRLWSRRVV
jgi:hypothetical protein